MNFSSAAKASLSRICSGGCFIMQAEATFSGPPNPPIERQLGAADGVDHHTRGVRRILDGKARFEVHGHVAKAAPLHPQEAHLVVLLPGHVVGGARLWRRAKCFLHRGRSLGLVTARNPSFQAVSRLGVTTLLRGMLHANSGDFVQRAAWNDGLRAVTRPNDLPRPRKAVDHAPSCPSRPRDQR